MLLCDWHLAQRFIHGVAPVRASFSQGLCEGRHRVLPVCSPVDGHLGCFHVLAVVNSAVLNIQALLAVDSA